MSDWYQQMLDDYAGPQPAPFCTATPTGTIETSLLLGSSWTSAADWTASGGLVEQLEAVLVAEVAYEDISKSSGTYTNARTTTLTLTKPLSSFSTIAEGSNALQLYTCWNIAAAVPTSFSSPTSSAFISNLVTKAVQNFYLRPVGSTSTGSSAVSVGSNDYILETGVLTALTPGTNCFPGTESNTFPGCLPSDSPSVDTQVWAYGSLPSTAIPCVSPFTGTTCTKAYHNQLPTRLLIAMEKEGDATYTNGAWAATSGPEHIYMRMAHAAGGLIPSRSASWPFPRADSSAVRGKTMPTGVIVALIMVGVVLVGVGVVSVVLAKHAHHVLHARSKLFGASHLHTPLEFQN